MPDSTLGELRTHRAFGRFWISRLFGGAANQMIMVAAAWQMYDLTGSAWDLGLVGLFQFAPVLAFTLIAGHVADRVHRARIVAAAVALQFAAAAVLLVATATGSLTRDLLFGISMLLGTATTFQRPAQGSLVASIVPVHLLARATALSSAGNQVSVIGGPALAGLLFAASPLAVYGVALALLLIAFVLVSLVDYVRDAGPGHPLNWNTLLAGVRFVWTRQVLLGAISLDLMAVLFGGATALLPIYARDILHAGPAGLGILRSSPAIGALAMSVLLARFPIRERVGFRLLAAVALYGICMLVFGVSRNFALSMAALAVSGAADMVSVVVRQTLVQLDTPDAMRGRVSAVSSIFIGASNQLGEFESGATAALLGPVGSVLLGGAGTLGVVAAWWKLFPTLAHRQTFEK